MEARQFDIANSSPAAPPRVHVATLTLSLPNQSLTLSGADDLCWRIGRDADADLVLDWPFISRTHAYLCFVRQSFLLVDVSSNGTYWCAEDGIQHFLHHARARLWGSGRLAFGEPLSAQAGIDFQIRD